MTDGPPLWDESRSEQSPVWWTRVSVAVALLAGLLIIVRLCAALWIVPAWESWRNVAAMPDLYPLLAQGLLDDGQLGFHGATAAPTISRGPGFAAYLVPAMLVSRQLDWLRAWSMLPGLGAALLLTWIVHKRYGTVSALSAGLICGLHPLALYVGARVMSDEFVAALGLAGLVSADVALREARARRRLVLAVVAGLCLDAAILTRATSAMLLVGTAILIWVARRKSVKPVGAVGALILIVALAGPVAWSIRSSRLAGEPVFVHSLAYYNLWMGKTHDDPGVGEDWGTTFRTERAPFSRLVPDIMGSDGERGYASLSPRETTRLENRLRTAFWEDVRSAPLTHVLRALRGLYRFWFQAQTTGRTWQYVLVQSPLLILALVGAYSGRGDRCGLMYALLAWLLATNVLYALTLPMARMSIQVLPATAAFAGIGIGRLASAPLPPFMRRLPPGNLRRRLPRQ